MRDNLITFAQFYKDVEDYLDSKLPDIPKCTRMEIAEYLTNKTVAHVVDAINERDREWKRAMDMQYGSRNRASRKEILERLRKRTYSYGDIEDGVEEPRTDESDT